MAILKQGLVQVYTGDGKGKTSAALGLAWRMLGQGGRVYICQFLKPPHRPTGEALLGGQFPERLTWEQLDEPWHLGDNRRNEPQIEAMRAAIARQLGRIAERARAGSYDLMILDELVVCLAKKLVDFRSVKELIEQRAGHVEMVLTGRGAPAELIGAADLVSRLEPVKHPYQRGIEARRGIEF
ncbi:MAG: cob(I)yrinic acid a,c-diamide adenosyltransferase [Sedimentisphaerales bacterium]|nr:cob(I)yrinic acid a,c-diamide adenosyltransferase [Sedimentisphaerales bacterium]